MVGPCRGFRHFKANDRANVLRVRFFDSDDRQWFRYHDCHLTFLTNHNLLVNHVSLQFFIIHCMKHKCAVQYIYSVFVPFTTLLAGAKVAVCNSFVFKATVSSIKATIMSIYHLITDPVTNAQAENRDG